jgi:hypothetical protein
MRDYDPTTGRYLEADPLGLVDGASVYGYARQNPGRWVDSRGECVGYFAAACVGALIGGGGDLLYQLYRNDWQFECVDWWEVAGFAALGAGLGAYGRAVFAVDAAAGASAAGTGAGVGGAGVGVGLATRGARPAPGARTTQGQVDAATQTGNPTVQRGGQDLFRLRSSGHGRSEATATPQNVRNITQDGRVYQGMGPDRPVTNRDLRELYKSQTGYGTNSIRTRSGR